MRKCQFKCWDRPLDSRYRAVNRIDGWIVFLTKKYVQLKRSSISRAKFIRLIFANKIIKNNVPLLIWNDKIRRSIVIDLTVVELEILWWNYYLKNQRWSNHVEQFFNIFCHKMFATWGASYICSLLNLLISKNSCGFRFLPLLTIFRDSCKYCAATAESRFSASYICHSMHISISAIVTRYPFAQIRCPFARLPLQMNHNSLW